MKSMDSNNKYPPVTYLTMAYEPINTMHAVINAIEQDYIGEKTIVLIHQDPKNAITSPLIDIVNVYASGKWPALWLAKLEAFVKDKEIPWTILFSGDPEATGMDNPMALKYGVMGVPTMILVGPDGKVVSLTARGPNLARELAKVYGPPEKKGEDKKDAEKKG